MKVLRAISRTHACLPGLAGRLRRRAAGGAALLVLTSLASLAQLPAAPPAAAATTPTAIAAGWTHSCLIRSGEAYCWGAGNYGELGVNSGLAASSVPVAVSTAGALSGVTLSQISAGQ